MECLTLWNIPQQKSKFTIQIYSSLTKTHYFTKIEPAAELFYINYAGIMGFKANELHTSNNMYSLIMGEKLQVEKRFPLSKEQH